MIVIKNKWFPFGGYKTINLFGILFTKSKLDNITLNHEEIHTAQMKEMLFIFFYLWYSLEYLIIRLCNVKDKQNDVYHEVSFEEEAYNNEDNLNYLKTRKHYSWFKYLNINSNKYANNLK